MQSKRTKTIKKGGLPPRSKIPKHMRGGFIQAVLTTVLPLIPGLVKALLPKEEEKVYTPEEELQVRATSGAKWKKIGNYWTAIDPITGTFYKDMDGKRISVTDEYFKQHEKKLRDIITEPYKFVQELSKLLAEID